MAMPSSNKARQIAKRPGKLNTGTTARAVPEWIGKSPSDWPPPTEVRLRIVLRQQGKCAISGMKFGPKAKARFDHIKPMADGGENRESNVQALLDPPHAAKSSAEATARAKTKRRQKTHLGIKDPPDRPLQSRNDLPGKQKPKTPYVPARGQPALMRQGFVPASEAKGKGRGRRG